MNATNLGRTAPEEMPQPAWDGKMADLEAIHREIAPQLTALRLAVEEDDALNDEFELSFVVSGR